MVMRNVLKKHSDFDNTELDRIMKEIHKINLMLNYDPRKKEVGDRVKIWNFASVSNDEGKIDQEIEELSHEEIFIVIKVGFKKEYDPSKNHKINIPLIIQNIQVASLKTNRAFYAHERDVKLVDENGYDTYPLDGLINEVDK